MPKSKKLPIHMTASMVKTLSSFVFYLKHIAKKNDLIIFDEPEINLHPSAQIELARIFGKLYNRGLRMIISTHSDYIIREINNLIMADQLKQDNAFPLMKFGISDDEAVNKDSVAVYNFVKKSKKIVRVNNLEVTSFGFEIDEINAAIDSQNNCTNEMFDYLYYSKHDKDRG